MSSPSAGSASSPPAAVPNARGRRAREAVLDAAEQLMAERGYDAATTAAIVEAAGVPISSIYHYFGSKDGILLAVMERGAQRFFNAIELPTESTGPPDQQLRVGVRAVASALQQHPSFLRLLLTLSMRPPAGHPPETLAVLRRVREQALLRLRAYLSAVLGIEADSRSAHQLARTALALLDGAFVAGQAEEPHALTDILDHLPSAILGVHHALST